MATIANRTPPITPRAQQQSGSTPSTPRALQQLPPTPYFAAVNSQSNSGQSNANHDIKWFQGFLAKEFGLKKDSVKVTSDSTEGIKVTLTVEQDSQISSRLKVNGVDLDCIEDLSEADGRLNFKVTNVDKFLELLPKGLFKNNFINENSLSFSQGGLIIDNGKVHRANLVERALTAALNNLLRTLHIVKKSITQQNISECLRYGISMYKNGEVSVTRESQLLAQKQLKDISDIGQSYFSKTHSKNDAIRLKLLKLLNRCPDLTIKKDELKKIDINLKTFIKILRNADFKDNKISTHVKDAGFSVSELIDAGFSLSELIDAGFSREELIDAVNKCRPEFIADKLDLADSEFIAVLDEIDGDLAIKAITCSKTFAEVVKTASELNSFAVEHQKSKFTDLISRLKSIRSQGKNVNQEQLERDFELLAKDLLDEKKHSQGGTFVAREIDVNMLVKHLKILDRFELKKPDKNSDRSVIVPVNTEGEIIGVVRVYFDTSTINYWIEAPGQFEKLAEIKVKNFYQRMISESPISFSEKFNFLIEAQSDFICLDSLPVYFSLRLKGVDYGFQRTISYAIREKVKIQDQTKPNDLIS